MHTGFRRRVARLAWWFGLPAVGLWMVLRGPAPDVSSVLDVLPLRIQDLLYWYPATWLGLCVLGAFVWKRGRRAPRGCAAATSLPALFLPVYLAGLESVRLVSWCLRCTPGVEISAADKITWGLVTNAELLAFAMLACGLAARLCGHRSRLWLPVAPAAGAIAASAALQWGFLVYLVRALSR